MRPARLTPLDYARAIALVAISEPNGEMLGVVWVGIVTSP
jgi:hypothetical protein